jgi:adenosylmethionine-8-amino-7-oxononanoate aminotransferase
MSGAPASRNLPSRTHLGGSRPVLVRGEGCYVWDREGRRYLDATSGAFCANLGYTRPDLVDAMRAAAARLPHARPSAFDSEESEAYRAELLAAAGAPFARVLLTSSGSEAVEAAMKVAVAYHRARGDADRTTVRSLAGHYHGATFGALGVTGWEARREPWAGVVGPRADGLPVPDDRSAALIAETIPVAGLGVAMPAAGTMAARRAACDAAGALWIADEVLTGFGRCGALFAWQRLIAGEIAGGSGVGAGAGVDAGADAEAVPDLVVFGKGAGAGFAALAGVLVSERVAAALESGDATAVPFAHHQSHGGNPIASAVGRAVIRAFAAEGIDARTRSSEASTACIVDEAAGAGSNVRGMGALWAVAPVGATAEAGAEAEALHRALRERNTLTHWATGDVAAGAPGAVVMAPPLTADEETWAALGAALADAATASRLPASR